MEKQGKCPNCQQYFRMPLYQCFTKCSNCQQLIVYLCHVQPGKPSNMLLHDCSICHKIYSIFTCPTCSGAIAIQKFMAGEPYACPCGFVCNIMVCNRCKSGLALPYGQDYQQSHIKCKNCLNNFRYRKCELCKAIIFKPQNQKDNSYICPNPNCAISNMLIFKSQPMNELMNLRISKFQQQAKLAQSSKGKTTISQKQLCKICLDRQVQMINLTCCHLSVCQLCSKSLKNKCPICRAQGQYKKVFKA